MNGSKSLLIILLIVQAMTIQGQEYVLRLYDGPIPNSRPAGLTEKTEKTDITSITHVQIPDIAVYLPTKKFATGQAVIICPGGGYEGLSYNLEGTDIARYFNSIGIAGIVLKYRLPSAESCMEPHKVPLMDAQRAMRLVRYNAVKWNTDPTKIGIMGFSAGGHLASTLGTHFDYGNKSAVDSVEKQSCRPDFMILVYPVITMSELSTHRGSKRALLGENPDNMLVQYYSNELQVKEDTPPAFLVHANDDSTVPVENSLLMFNALREKKIPVELHILSEGEHGFGLGLDNDHVASWTNSVRLWLGWLNLKR
jgi:acetyl esterase/lipase